VAAQALYNQQKLKVLLLPYALNQCAAQQPLLTLRLGRHGDATEGLLQGQLGSGIVYTMCTQPTLLLLDRWCLGLVLGIRRTMGGSTGALHSEESR
jgi:hypothetical protein